jgi:hypothetical protein
MLSNDSGSGMMTLIGGMMLLVFAGVGLSIAVDGRFGYSSQVSMLENEIKGGEQDLQRLGALHAESSHQMLNLEPGRRVAMAELKALKGRLDELRRRHELLRAAHDGAHASVLALERTFSDYRSRHRERVWTAAQGLDLGNLETRGGRTYRNAVVRRVTEAGLEIRHADGTARVAAGDLQGGLRQRFLWE